MDAMGDPRPVTKVTADLLAKARAKVKEARAAGFSDPDIDDYLKGEIGQGLAQVMDPTFRDYARSAGMGMTLGFLDELAGAGAAIVPGGKGYTEARDAVRANQAGAEYAAPKRMMTAELAGGLVPGLLTAGAGEVAAGAGAGAKALQAAKVGGLLSAVSGVGHSNADNISDVAKDAAMSGAAGTVAGGGLSLLGSAAGRVASGVADRVNPSRAVVREAATQIPPNAATSIARQNAIAPGTAMLADQSPEMTAMVRGIGADADAGVAARTVADARVDALKTARKALGTRYEALERDLPVDKTLAGILRDADQPVTGPATNFVQLHRARMDLRAAVKNAEGAKKADLGKALDALNGWMDTNVPGVRQLDRDYGFVVERIKAAEKLAKEVTSSSKNYAASRTYGAESGSIGGSLPRGAHGVISMMAEALGPDRAARARAVQDLLLTPGDATSTALAKITAARARMHTPPSALERMGRGGLFGGVIPTVTGRSASLLSP